MNKKTIRMVCYGPIAVSPKYFSSWEDVWIQYHVGRKIVTEGPCICGTTELRSEIKTNSTRIKKDWRQKLLHQLETVMERLNKGELFVVKNDNFSNRFPDIYINTESINRKWAERAVEWYLREKGILKSQPRFSWNKIKGKNFLIPVTIGGYE